MNPDNAEVGGFTASNVRGGATATSPTSSEEVDALLSLFPGPLTLWPDRVRTLRGLMLTFIFVMTAMVLAVLLPPQRYQARGVFVRDAWRMGDGHGRQAVAGCLQAHLG